MPNRAPTVVVDTSPWIALIANESDRAEHVERLLVRAEAGEVQVLVSTLTITEIVKGPAAADPALSEDEERTFTGFMDNPYVTLVAVDPVVAARGSDLRRAVLKLKTPDAVIVATALVTGAQTLYTYDKDDLLKLDGHPAIGPLRIMELPVEDVQLALQIESD